MRTILPLLLPLVMVFVSRRVIAAIDADGINPQNSSSLFRVASQSHYLQC
jgi:hypothetical protein